MVDKSYYVLNNDRVRVKRHLADFEPGIIKFKRVFRKMEEKKLK